MKFNEPVRPAGVGRRQVAFETSRNPSAFTLIENEDNDGINPESQSSQDIATFANSTAMARSIAYSAASSAVANNQNEIWGLRGVADFTTDTNGYGYVKWDNKGTMYNYNWAQINNTFMYVDSEDSAKIIVNRPGWYLVDAMVKVTNFKQAQQYRMDILLDNTEIIVVGFDAVHTNDYPTLRVNAIVPIPAYVTDITPEITRYFRVRWQGIGITSATTIEADGFIHAIWLKPWEADETHANS